MGIFTVLIYMILSFAAGILCLGVSVGWIRFTVIAPILGVQIVSSQLMSDIYSQWLLGLSGALIIILYLRYVQSLLLRPRREKIISFGAPDGKVTITLSAIEDMLRKMLEERGEFSHVRPKVISRKKGIEVIIRSNLTSEVNLLELTNEVQETIKERLQHLLGEDKEIKVRIKIGKMAFAEAQAAGKEPEVPFRNY